MARPRIQTSFVQWKLGLLVVPFLALAGLARFSVSFFLARRSLPAASACTKDAAADLMREVLGLNTDEIRLLSDGGLLGLDNGCWMPRTVDSVVMVVVDALRFDFAVGRLPKSIGARLHRSSSSIADNSEGTTSSSQLYTFVADPPTVTMQRLKGLTTGGLPTFADISGNFGGANVDEDSWIQQLKDVPAHRRGSRERKIAFVGDDTWIDLFPTQFDDAHPYPSFNTRDLDTVDDGCMKHLPSLLQKLDSDEHELVVAHFLGVDHVGHTYGPHDQHMTEKLNQIDDILSYVLDRVDSAQSTSCRVAFVFGDHGMTEDGNHGGGTQDETNAALFVHYSSGCGHVPPSSVAPGVFSTDTTEEEKDVFDSIHQIDLVPTISILLGLPIPYANLGGVVPSLLPPLRQTATIVAHKISQDEALAAALALNAAQIWNYLDTYSRTANALPPGPMAALENSMRKATDAYKSALLSSKKKTLDHGRADGDSSLSYSEACILYKFFLSEAAELGHRVWTRFDATGMILGAFTLLCAFLLSLFDSNISGSFSRGMLGSSSSSFLEPTLRSLQTGGGGELAERGLSLLFMVFQCAMLTFSNSYIDSEKEIVMFLLAVLCVFMSTRRAMNCVGKSFVEKAALKEDNSLLKFKISKYSNAFLPVFIAACSRANELFVTGHGLDPSIVMHASHFSGVWLSSLLLMGIVRFFLEMPITNILSQWKVGVSLSADIACLFFLAFSWWEKRSPDHGRHGYLTCRAAMMLSLIGVLLSIFQRCRKSVSAGSLPSPAVYQSVLFKSMIFATAVTGPSTAASSVLFLAQAWALCRLGFNRGADRGIPAVAPSVAASLWRLSIRHAFFATNHGCAFNRLQYSAAFVAFDEFHFHTAGISLFFNTFGWEIIGSLFLLMVTRRRTRSAKSTEVKGGGKGTGAEAIWKWFCLYQLLEAVGSCLSVSLMRRHLMVWAIFAPRFIFAAVFTTLNLACRAIGVMISS